MRLEPLTAGEETPGLEEEFRAAREIGRLRLGTAHLFLRTGTAVRYIPYQRIRRYFRRVEDVPLKLCCGRGSMASESLVVCGDSGELAQVPLPDTRAARIVMERMAQLAPDAAVGPEKPRQTNERSGENL